MIKDVLIIGAGPAGLYAWKLARNYDLSGTIVDAEKSYGGQVNRLYPTKTLRNLPGIDIKIAKNVMDEMYNMIEKDESIFEQKFFCSVEKIEMIDENIEKNLIKNYFKVTFSDKTTQVYKKILCTIGIGFYERKKLLEKDYENILYGIDNLKKFKDKKILVFGGGDSAIDFANELINWTKTVKLIHRRNEFRGALSGVNEAAKNGVEVLTPYVFKSILKEENNLVKEIELENCETKKVLKLDFEYAVVNFGADWKMEKDFFINYKVENNHIIVDENMMTSIEGVYAAGDCCTYKGKINNIVSAFYEAMKAILNIDKLVKDRNKLGNGW
ncbi:NAD(P)/FAD-dependent oxidoreductase [Spiroplasma tabanidicola]|uniref:Ferredoxin--NADP reductase n=1 Tax=Spiroplasma tabanidicola TaxID=324079 RepID=A0A6I6C643_9MOLU|nr:NAD(P)/FAD-dependent oxidoreductase [Spiroplasma tabanidicola]QGS51620.1 thioredoxin reductase [Spiroplasma tabanidicola]